jgi:putative ABC transport system permease protein
MRTFGPLKHVLRRLARSPIFTAVTLVTLAVGIGANTAIFSVINGVLLKPLAYPEPDRLVSIWHTAPALNLGDVNMSPSMYFTYREENRSFQSMGVWASRAASVTGLAEPEQVRSLYVTDGVLQSIGIPPLLGRWIHANDDTPGSPDTVLLTYGYWQRKFGGNASALGRKILVDGKSREIIGILPQRFRFFDDKLALVIPYQFDRSKVILGNFSFNGIARLKPGVTLEQANADVARMIPISIRRFPPPPGFSAKLFESAHFGPLVRPLKRDVIGDVGTVLWVLMGTIGIVLLIACANVANLLLVRAEGRQQELAIRAALGAGWTRIARELLLESVFLGWIGGLLGLGLAYGALRLLVYLGPATLPRLNEISIDPVVLLFTLAISLFAGVLFGLVPVFKYAGPHLAQTLRGGGRSLSHSRERHRARSILVVVQVALALVLLISSGLMIRTFQAMKHVQPGFANPEEVQTFRVFIPEAQVKEPERVTRMQYDMLVKLAALPGVSSAAISNSVPMDRNNSNDLVYAEDRSYGDGQIPPVRRYKFIGPGFFHTMGNRIVAGRDLTWTDIYDKRMVVMISENLAREMWKDPAAALGKRIREGMKDPWREIVGVVGDVRDNGVNEKAPAMVYWPILMKAFWGDETNVTRFAAFSLRSPRAGSESFLNEVRQAVWSVNPDVPVADVQTLREVYERSMARTSFTLVMLAIAGSMALLLGIVGVYGVISYSVSQRTREIGIRMALGAQQQALKQMFVRHGLLLAAIGVACGLSGAVALTRLMASLLYEVKAVDPLTYIAVSAGLVGAAAAASYFPARKATAVDPVEALRAE